MRFRWSGVGEQPPAANVAGETMAELALEYEVGKATIWRALQPEAKQAA